MGGISEKLIGSVFLSTLSLRRATRRKTTDMRQRFIFLSTLSLRRATRAPSPPKREFYISIHALLAESDFMGPVRGVSLLKISIHALLAESDGPHSVSCQAMQEFLSTLSLRRATATKNRRTRSNRISIHALLAESDPLTSWAETITTNFYPRSPCGERP